jgi:hypothetical protein
LAGGFLIRVALQRRSGGKAEALRGLKARRPVTWFRENFWIWIALAVE